MKSTPFFIGLALLAPVLGAEERALRIDAAQSRVDVVVQATVDSFTGTLAAYDADIRVDTETGAVAAARFDFRFADVKTAKAARDEQMHAWQGTSTYPLGRFTLTEIVRDEAGASHARGELLLHGVSRELRFPISVTREGARYAMDGDAVVDTRRFGLPIIRKFAVLKVDPEVHVRFHLQGELPAE